MTEININKKSMVASVAMSLVSQAMTPRPN